MKFIDLVDNYLRDYINESVTLNIISLIKTIKLCEDIENVTIDNYVYSNNKYAMNIYDGDIIRGYQRYVIWYIYKNDNYDIQIISIYEDCNNDWLAGDPCNNDPLGVKHKFKELEIEYLIV